MVIAEREITSVGICQNPAAREVDAINRRMRAVARTSSDHKDFVHFTAQATAFYLIAQLTPGRGKTLRFRYLEKNPDMDSSIRSLTKVAKLMIAEPGTTQEKIASMTMHNFDIRMKKGPIRNESFDIK